MISHPQRIMNLFVQLDRHNGVMLLPFPTPMPGMHLSGGCLIQAKFLGKSKHSADQVIADGVSVVAKGHEVAHTIIPHINIGPFNILMPLHILTSSNKCVLAASTVKVPDGDLAVTFVGFPFIGLNLACNDPFNMPTCITFNGGTVKVGISWLDIFIALALWALDIVIGAIVKYLSKLLGSLVSKVFDKLFPGLRKAIFMGIMRQFNTVVKNNPEIFLRAGETLAKSGIMTLVDKGFQSTSLHVADEVISSIIDKAVLSPAIENSGLGEMLENQVEQGVTEFADQFFPGSASLP